MLLLNDRKNHIFPSIEFVEIAVENKVFCYFSDGPRGEIWVILAGREDILAALEESGLRRWKVAFVRSGKKRE